MPWLRLFKEGWAPTTRSLATSCTESTTVCFLPGKEKKYLIRFQFQLLALICAQCTAACFRFAGAAGWSISCWRWSTGYLTWRWWLMSGIILKSPAGCSQRCRSSLSVRSDLDTLENRHNCLLNKISGVYFDVCLFDSSRQQTTRTSCTLRGRFGRADLLCGRYTPLDWEDGIWWGRTWKSKVMYTVYTCILTVAEIIMQLV